MEFINNLKKTINSYYQEDLTSWKGQEMFIEALNLVNKEMPEKPFSASNTWVDQGRKVYKKKLIKIS